VPQELAKQNALRSFGAGLRRERVAAGITQERLAELADLNPRTVQKIEAGQLDVLLSTVCRLRNALACGWDQIMPASKK
jgi:transcriptional regulator with XRE-family HTH domain